MNEVPNKGKKINLRKILQSFAILMIFSSLVYGSYYFFVAKDQEIQEEDMSDWNTFTDVNNTFMFRYPADFALLEQDGDVIVEKTGASAAVSFTPLPLTEDSMLDLARRLQEELVASEPQIFNIGMRSGYLMKTDKEGLSEELIVMPLGLEGYLLIVINYQGELRHEIDTIVSSVIFLPQEDN